MSSLTTESRNNHLALRVREADQLIQDLAQLEAGVAMEVQRLERMTAPTSGPLPLYRGRPVSWWRVKLAVWAWSRRTEQRYVLDALQGLRLVLTEWNDDQLAMFVDHLCSDAAPSSAA